jgi:glycosyltransferase involved in cell wall biosynthesis
VSALLDLSIVVPTLNERENVALLIPSLERIVASLSITAEILVIDGGSTDGTGEQASSQGARVIVVPTGGYGEAIRVGLAEAAGAYVVTMDADLSHEPRVVADLWAARGPLTIAIASRYVRGGSSEDEPHALGPEPLAQHRVRARALAAGEGSLQWLPHLSGIRGASASRAGRGLRRPAGASGARALRGLADRRGAIQVRPSPLRELEGARLPARPRLHPHLRPPLAAP